MRQSVQNEYEQAPANALVTTRGAHRVLQVRTAVIDGRLREGLLRVAA
jgi:hypothetical protein